MTNQEQFTHYKNVIQNCNDALMQLKIDQLAHKWSLDKQIETLNKIQTLADKLRK